MKNQIKLLLTIAVISLFGCGKQVAPEQVAHRCERDQLLQQCVSALSTTHPGLNLKQFEKKHEECENIAEAKARKVLWKDQPLTCPAPLTK